MQKLNEYKSNLENLEQKIDSNKLNIKERESNIDKKENAERDELGYAVSWKFI